MDQKQTSFILTTFGGKDPKVYYIEKNPFTIGRSHENDYPIISDVVSRIHLKVSLVKNNIYIRDLGSSNGTYLDGEKLTPNKDYLLLPEQRLRIGDLEEEFSIQQKKPQRKIIDVEAVKSNASIQYTVPNNQPELTSTAREKAIAAEYVKAENIVENAKKMARTAIREAEEQAEKTLTSARVAAEKIVIDSETQSELVARNYEEIGKTIVHQAKVDAQNILEKANNQSKAVMEKATREAETVAMTAKRDAESIVKTAALEVENKRITIEQEAILKIKETNEVIRLLKVSEEEKIKDMIFKEKEKMEKELGAQKQRLALNISEKKSEFEAALERLDIQQQEAKEKLKSLADKEARLNEVYVQKSLDLQLAYDVEKKKTALELIQDKQKYQSELEDYKKKELEKINHFIQAEQKRYAETKSLQILELTRNYQNIIINVLNKTLQGQIPDANYNQLIISLKESMDSVNIKPEKIASTIEMDDLRIAAPLQQNKNSKYVIGAAGFLLLAITVTLGMFWKNIFSYLNTNSKFTQFVIEKQRADSVYVPTQTPEWRSTYFERILYMTGYTEIKTSQIYLDKWTKQLTDVEFARTLKLTEDDMIRFLAREMNFVQQVIALQQSMDARYLDESLSRIRNIENEAMRDFLSILKSAENVETVMTMEKKFTLAYMQKTQFQNRLPTNNDQGN